MHMCIVSTGKIRAKYVQLGIEEFSKRLKPYCKLTFAEVEDERVPENYSAKEIEKAMHKEAERILRHVHPDSYTVALAIDGVSWTSEQLAAKVDQLLIHGRSHVTFIIGGSNGLHDSVLKRADLCLSFSKLTFPHQLMKLILMEQLYRAMMIRAGNPYHK